MVSYLPLKVKGSTKHWVFQNKSFDVTFAVIIPGNPAGSGSRQECRWHWRISDIQANILIQFDKNVPSYNQNKESAKQSDWLGPWLDPMCGMLPVLNCPSYDTPWLLKKLHLCVVRCSNPATKPKVPLCFWQFWVRSPAWTEWHKSFSSSTKGQKSPTPWTNPSLP